jgi:hypothetical protein
MTQLCSAPAAGKPKPAFVEQSSTISYQLVKDQMFKCERRGATFACSQMGPARGVDSQLNVMIPSSSTAAKPAEKVAASGPAKVVATPEAVEVVASHPAMKVTAPAAKTPLVAAADHGHAEHDDNHDFTEAVHKVLSEQLNGDAQDHELYFTDKDEKDKNAEAAALPATHVVVAASAEATKAPVPDIQEFTIPAPGEYLTGGLQVFGLLPILLEPL